MKNNKYTKKQITEAIAYWKKQLRLGNYKKINESKTLDEASKTAGLESPYVLLTYALEDPESYNLEPFTDAQTKFLQSIANDYIDTLNELKDSIKSINEIVNYD